MKNGFFSGSVAMYCIIFCGFITLFGAYGAYFGNGSEVNVIIMERGLQFLKLFTALFLLQNSTVFDGKLGPAFKIIAGIGILAFAFKILHWKGADMMLLFSFTAAIACYSVHFALKKKIGTGDILKEAWVVTTLTAALLTMLHQLYQAPLQTASLVCTIAILAWFMIKERGDAKNSSSQPGTGQ